MWDLVQHLLPVRAAKVFFGVHLSLSPKSSGLTENQAKA